MMANKVRICLELNQEAVKLLNANLQADGMLNWLTGNEPLRRLDVRGVVALVVLAEARGARNAEIHAAIPLEWRGAIQPVSGMRQVVDESEGFEELRRGVRCKGEAESRSQSNQRVSCRSGQRAREERG